MIWEDKIKDFGFDGPSPKPAGHSADRFAKALLRFIEAENELKAAKKAVPNYTGQYSKADFIANEQEEWNRASDDMWRLIQSDR